MSDWTGNSKSAFSTISATNHANKGNQREKHDYYATDPRAIDFLIDGGGILGHNIWEPACGEGHLSKRLEELGYNVKSTDLIDRGFGTGGIDFLKCAEIWHGDIVTNPPYKYALEFVEHALELINDGNKVFMFLKLTFLESKKRRKLFERGCLRRVWVSHDRISCGKNGIFTGERSAVAHAWFEWQKGYKGDPVIKWIN